ncbi:ankyrin repeat domain-containing protein 28 [Nannizzia gypsea CBS 118893]|uniref:Ankyrin repeat domain-containing protein 28 n=1 Tax=Arthroderma gypseum (strain ATCC MYA-4604 / CBS 118893) TaxID=535722 RepID=E4UQ99_ARTGP|nr:ankyrin repeat domain-containing protein 28 [Nannizzia gypsea CBS 118893]EFQ99180.1 ankyrin repeat domain-containing protein 28 [Nannizzia gypsea CBS 118893]
MARPQSSRGDTYENKGLGDQFNTPGGTQYNYTGSNTTVNNYHDIKPPKALQERCLESLRFSGIDDRLNSMEDAAEGTCEWLIQHKKYKNWASRDRSLLWIKGKPGSGKSTLLQYALKNAEKTPNIGESNPIFLSFFFYDRGNTEQKTPLGFFQSLLYQLLCKAPDAMGELLTAFEERENKGEHGVMWHWYQKELHALFESSLRDILKIRPIWLFVDALDECTEPDMAMFIQKLKLGFQQLPPTSLPCRVCFTSRQHSFQNQISDLDVESEISVESHNGRDISTYVTSRLSIASMLSIAEKKAVAEKITERARGIFMWARLVVVRVLELEPYEPTEAIVEEIMNTSQDLYDLYAKLIEKVKGNPGSLKLLQWICFAKRPLSLDELRWAMAVDADIKSPYRSLKVCKNTTYYTSKNQVIEGRVKTYSCGITEVIQLSTGPIVQFIHQSAKDFLVEKGLSLLDCSRIPGGRDNAIGRAHYQISRTCIRYLSMEEVAQSTVGKSRFSYSLTDRFILASRFPLLEYTCSWISHVQKSDAQGVPQDDLLDYFNWPSEGIVRTWAHYHWVLDRTLESYQGHSTLLHLMAENRIIGPCRAILKRADEESVDITATDGDGRTPLHLAAASGDDTIVELLLSTGKFDVEDHTYLHLRPVRWLMRKKLPNPCKDDINTADMGGQTPLWHAISRGHAATVKLLLNQRKIDVNNGKPPPLCEAARKGRGDIVKLLLETGKVNINAQDMDNQTALHYATGQSTKSPVKVLDTSKVNTNARDKFSRTAHHCATSRSAAAIVKLLLDTGKADINAQDNHGNTALYNATFRQEEAVVKVLLETGKANVNIKDNDGNTAFYTAIIIKSWSIVKLLLDTGKVDINMQGYGGITALHRATSYSTEAIVKLLLDTGKVNINARDDFGSTALHYAIDREPEGATIYQIEAIVKLLLETGKIDVNIQDNDGETALHYATSLREEAVVKLLLETGKAHINIKDDNGNTAFHTAIFREYYGIAKLFLDTGKVDINVENNFGDTPLEVAIEEGRTDLVHLMRDIGSLDLT